MDKWYRKDIGAGVAYEAAMEKIKREWLAMEIVDQQGPENPGVFCRLNYDTGMNEVYFTPNLKRLAMQWDAEECEKPGPSQYRIGLLCGALSARSYHFADESIYRRQ